MKLIPSLRLMNFNTLLDYRYEEEMDIMYIEFSFIILQKEFKSIKIIRYYNMNVMRFLSLFSFNSVDIKTP